MPPNIVFTHLEKTLSEHELGGQKLVIRVDCKSEANAGHPRDLIIRAVISAIS